MKSVHNAVLTLANAAFDLLQMRVEWEYLTLVLDDEAPKPGVTQSGVTQSGETQSGETQTAQPGVIQPGVTRKRGCCFGLGTPLLRLLAALVYAASNALGLAWLVEDFLELYQQSPGLGTVALGVIAVIVAGLLTVLGFCVRHFPDRAKDAAKRVAAHCGCCACCVSDSDASTGGGASAGSDAKESAAFCWRPIVATV